MVNKNLHLIAGLRPELKAILTDRNDAGEGGGTTTTLPFTTEEMKCLEKISTTIHMDGGPLDLIQSISSGYFFEFLKKDEPQWSPPEEPAVQTLTAAQKKKCNVSTEKQSRMEQRNRNRKVREPCVGTSSRRTKQRQSSLSAYQRIEPQEIPRLHQPVAIRAREMPRIHTVPLELAETPPRTRAIIFSRTRLDRMKQATRAPSEEGRRVKQVLDPIAHNAGSG